MSHIYTREEIQSSAEALAESAQLSKVPIALVVDAGEAWTAHLVGRQLDLVGMARCMIDAALSDADDDLLLAAATEFHRAICDAVEARVMRGDE